MTTTVESQANAVTEVSRFAAVRYWYRNLWLLAVVCAGGLAYSVWWAVDVYHSNPRQFMDLDAYRLGVQAWLHGKDMYGHLPLSVTGVELPFIYPPFAAAIFSPLALISFNHAAIGMLLASMVCLATVIYLSVRRAWPEGGKRGALLASGVALPLSLTTEPVYDTFWYGQINLVLTLLVALDCLVVKPKWPRGIGIGLAAAVKLTPGVFLLYFLLRKDFRTSVTIVVSAAVMTAIGFAVSWTGSLKYWFGSTGGARSISGTGFIGNQSVDGWLARLGFPQHEQNLLWLASVVVLTILAAAAIVRAHRMDNATLAMAVTACFGLLASPVSWGHHWVYAMVPGIVAMFAVGIRRRSVLWLLAAIGASLVAAIPPYFHVIDGGTVLTVGQQLKANSFTVVGLVLLIGFIVPPVLRRLRTRLARASG